MTTQTEIPASACEAGSSHHWILETPNGPTCEAYCKKCQRTRTYATTTPDNLWESEKGKAGVAAKRFAAKNQKAPGAAWRGKGGTIAGGGE